MRWVSLFSIVVLLPGRCCQAQMPPNTVTEKPASSSPGFTINVAPPSDRIQLKAPIMVTVTVTNISGQDFDWASDRGPNGPYKEFGYLLTKDGREIETTFFHRKLTGRQRADDPQEVESGSSILIPHPPGVMFVFKIDLKRLYEIKEPGVYTLDVRRFVDYSKTTVRSNSLTLKIVL
jgi:hypothetical protein